MIVLASFTRADLKLSALGFHYNFDPTVHGFSALVQEDCTCNQKGGPSTGKAFHSILVPSIPRAYVHGLVNAGHLWLFYDHALQSEQRVRIRVKC